MTKYRDPLQPTTTVVHVMVTLVTTLVALGVIATIVGSGSLFGIGSPSVCAEVRNGAVSMPPSGTNVTPGVEDGVVSSTRSVALCTSSPTVGQRIPDALTSLPTFLVLIGALALAMRLFGFMRRHGIFTTGAADRLRAVGWFVLLGEVVATLTEAIARFWLTNTMLDEPAVGFGWINDWDVPLLALFLGVVLISFARVMRLSTVMREELDGTV